VEENEKDVEQLQNVWLIRSLIDDNNRFGEFSDSNIIAVVWSNTGDLPKRQIN
jgi:hypothetical protein